MPESSVMFQLGSLVATGKRTLPSLLRWYEKHFVGKREVNYSLPLIGSALTMLGRCIQLRVLQEPMGGTIILPGTHALMPQGGVMRYSREEISTAEEIPVEQREQAMRAAFVVAFGIFAAIGAALRSGRPLGPDPDDSAEWGRLVEEHNKLLALLDRIIPVMEKLDRQGGSGDIPRDCPGLLRALREQLAATADAYRGYLPTKDSQAQVQVILDQYLPSISSAVETAELTLRCCGQALEEAALTSSKRS